MQAGFGFARVFHSKIIQTPTCKFYIVWWLWFKLKWCHKHRHYRNFTDALENCADVLKKQKTDMSEMQKKNLRQCKMCSNTWEGSTRLQNRTQTTAALPLVAPQPTLARVAESSFKTWLATNASERKKSKKRHPQKAKVNLNPLSQILLNIQKNCKKGHQSSFLSSLSFWMTAMLNCEMIRIYEALCRKFFQTYKVQHKKYFADGLLNPIKWWQIQ